MNMGASYWYWLRRLGYPETLRPSAFKLPIRLILAILHDLTVRLNYTELPEVPGFTRTLPCMQLLFGFCTTYPKTRPITNPTRNYIGGSGYHAAFTRPAGLAAYLRAARKEAGAGPELVNGTFSVLKGSKVPSYAVCAVSTLGIVAMASGIRCHTFEYLDPQGWILKTHQPANGRLQPLTEATQCELMTYHRTSCSRIRQDTPVRRLFMGGWGSCRW